MREAVFLHVSGLILGIIMDQIVGDPHFMPHPVRAMGSLISFLEKKFLGDGPPDKKKSAGEDKLSEGRGGNKERLLGVITWLVVVIITALVTLGILVASYIVNTYLGVAVEAILTCYILAARSLYKESMAVSGCLERGDISAARYALSMIVGRDTEHLDTEEITKAAVETVAENTSDGVIAPLIFTALGGPVLGMVYKAVNTMDSMLGYRNERYRFFGWFAARADDLFNFLPSRLSALVMIAGAYLLGIFSDGYSGKGAIRIWLRDRNNHSSPNSAQTESTCAGALGLRLGGAHLYGGVSVPKPAIGDETRQAVIEDIRRANYLMLATEFLSTLILVVGIMII